MYKISTLNKISPVGLAHFSDKYTVTDDIDSANAIIVRSQDMHDMNFGEYLLAIGRAGAGVNNIPVDKCADLGIVVFNTPGANANAVKELVIASMIMSARNLAKAIPWANSLTENVAKTVEKGKKQFAGTEIKGKKLAVYGLGAIGVMVANAASDLGMYVTGYDPFLAPKNAHGLYPCVKVVDDPKYMLNDADYVSIHVPASPATNGMIDKGVISQMKDGVVFLNFSRDKLVNVPDLAEAVNSGKIKSYITDFPIEEMATVENVTLVPHLGASTAEAEDNCATISVTEIMDYIENGNISNSVNFPAVSLGALGNATRLCFCTKGMQSPVDYISKNIGLTIDAAVGGVKGDHGYVLIDTSDEVTSIPKMDGVVRARVIQQ